MFRTKSNKKMEISTDITNDSEKHPIPVINCTDESIADIIRFLRVYTAKPYYESRTRKELKNIIRLDQYDNCKDCVDDCLVSTCPCRDKVGEIF